MITLFCLEKRFLTNMADMANKAYEPFLALPPYMRACGNVPSLSHPQVQLAISNVPSLSHPQIQLPKGQGGRLEQRIITGILKENVLRKRKGSIVFGIEDCFLQFREKETRYTQNVGMKKLVRPKGTLLACSLSPPLSHSLL